MKIVIASDHAGFALKNKIKEKYSNIFDFTDVGTYSEESCDYPDFAHKAAEAINNKLVEKGIIICGTGNGISMTANKHNGIRAALCWNTKIAEMARLHNDANILALPARFIDYNEAFSIIDTFFSTKFEGGRHQRRIDKIDFK